MKAIILMAGAGARLRPHTYTQPKGLIPVAGKTILSYLVDQLHLQGGITEFVFVVGYLGEKIEKYVRETYPQLTVHFVEQKNPAGTGHAISCTEDIVGDDEIFIALGDTIAEYDVKQVVNSSHSMLGVKQVTNPHLFGVAQIKNDGFIQQVEEHPVMPITNMALVGLYKIRETTQMFSSLHTLLQDVSARRNGDYNFTDALQAMIGRGIQFKAFTVQNWFDCGRKESLLDANAILLLKNKAATFRTDVFPGSIVLPPVSIAEGCTITNSIIGPNVAIGENTTIIESRVRNSIIGSYTTISEVVLKDSLIGSDAMVKGMSTSLNVGDNTEIEF